MKELIKPSRLKAGDTIAVVSLSWGGAGDAEFKWRYLQGKERLQALGFNVVEMPYALSGSETLYLDPQKRAADLMAAFKDPNVKGIFTCIGGDDSIRLLPYIDPLVVKAHPKVLIGYSDTTITHLLCFKAGLSSFYGPSILMEFAENIAMHDYTLNHFRKAVMETVPIGEIMAPTQWTGEYLPWLAENKNQMRQMVAHEGYECLQGEGTCEGRLVGGCIEVLEMAKGTAVWPTLDDFKESILFLETSEDVMEPHLLRYILRNYAAQGILGVIRGLVFGKPYQNQHYEAYKSEILKVLKEEALTNLPVFYNMAFGHSSPMVTLPYGAKAKLNCKDVTFTILESGVKES